MHDITNIKQTHFYFYKYILYPNLNDESNKIYQSKYFLTLRIILLFFFFQEQFNTQSIRSKTGLLYSDLHAGAANGD